MTASAPIALIFMPRYDVLRAFYLEGFWGHVSADVMRARPHPRANSIVWNMWHLARVEDAGLGLMVADRTQVFTEGDWQSRLNVPHRHQGSGMTLDEVEELSGRIDLEALHEYTRAVEARTREIVEALDPGVLGEPVPTERLHRAITENGLAYSDPEGLVKNYTGWSHGKCLTHFALTHAYQHVGEMDVLAGLQGVEF